MNLMTNSVARVDYQALANRLRTELNQMSQRYSQLWVDYRALKDCSVVSSTSEKRFQTVIDLLIDPREAQSETDLQFTDANAGHQRRERRPDTPQSEDKAVMQKIYESLERCREATEKTLKRSQTRANYNLVQDAVSRLESQCRTLVDHIQIYQEEMTRISGLISPFMANREPIDFQDPMCRGLVLDTLQNLAELVQEEHKEFEELQQNKAQLEKQLKGVKRDIQRSCRKIAQYTGATGRTLVEQCNNLLATKRHHQDDEKMQRAVSSFIDFIKDQQAVRSEDFSSVPHSEGSTSTDNKLKLTQKHKQDTESFKELSLNSMQKQDFAAVILAEGGGVVQAERRNSSG